VKERAFSVPLEGNLYELLINELTELVFVLLDTGGHFTSWHPGVEKQFGYARDEFIGQHLSLLLPEAELNSGVAERELQLAETAGSASDTRWLATKDRRRVFAQGLTLGLRDMQGSLAGFGKVIQDVTGSKEAGDDLRALTRALAQSTVLILRWDDVIEHWTTGCERLYGWTAQQAAGQVAHELLKTVFPEPLETIQAQLLASGAWQGELRQTKRDGAPLFVAAQWVLLSDESDEPRSIIATHTDITSRLEMQQELERANRRLIEMANELERSNEDLEEFARIASHDLSAPIMSTRWLVDLLSARHGSKLDAEGQKCLEQVSLGLDRMADLVEAVLAHARIGKGAIASEQTTRAEDALSAALENLRKDVETSEASISQDPLPEVFIQPQPLTQLFQNLLSNALKYRRPNVPPKIKVTSAKQGSMWQIGVTDNGIGIAPEWFERIFQPLQRCHGMDVPGSGIGLATCKKIVTRVGGKIWVESEFGAGSTLYFTLPGPTQSPTRADDSAGTG
jgi:PAS domain S-box-containing protein